MHKEFLDKVKEEIRSLRDLKKNWDGYGDDPVNPCVIDGMLRFVDEVLSVVDEVPIPYIIPGGECKSGGSSAQFEWHIRGKNISLEIELEEGHMIHYLKWDPENDLEKEELFEITSDNGVERCIELLLWIRERNKG